MCNGIDDGYSDGCGVKHKPVENEACDLCGRSIGIIGVSANGFLYCSDNCCYSHSEAIKKPVWYC